MSTFICLQHDRLKYSCQECEVKFKWWNSVIRHWKDYHNVTEENISDSLPDDTVETEEQYVNRNVKTSQKPPFYCGICKMYFTSIQNFCSHLTKCWCQCTCGNQSDSIRNFVLHMRTCRIGEVGDVWFSRGDQVVTPWDIQCPGCSYKAMTQDQLVQHLVQLHWHKGIGTLDPVYKKGYVIVVLRHQEFGSDISIITDNQCTDLISLRNSFSHKVQSTTVNSSPSKYNWSNYPV